MNSLTIALIVFLLTSAASHIGSKLRFFLPNEHFSSSSVDVIKLSMGLIATVTALILGLTVSSANNVFNSANTEVQKIVVSTIILDGTLAQYGNETAAIRESMTDILKKRFADENAPPVSFKDAPNMTKLLNNINMQIINLHPSTPAQEELKNKIMANFDEAVKARWALLSTNENIIPPPFLIILTFWLTLIFLCFGLCADENHTIIAIRMLCALSVSMAIFLAIELQQPLSGLIQVSDAPIRYMLETIGKP